MIRRNALPCLLIAAMVMLTGAVGQTRGDNQASATYDPAKGLLIADGGKAMHRIVISPDASPKTRAIAGELLHFLQLATGSLFQVSNSAPGDGIIFGNADEFPDLLNDQQTEALKIRDHFDGREAYIIKTQPNRLLLIGATEAGASHAAYRFLHEIGYRWFFPSPQWQIVPDQPTLWVNLDLVDRPKFLTRRLTPDYGFFDRHAQNDFYAWTRRNNLGESIRTDVSYAWQSIIAQNIRVFNQNPQFLAMVGGQRTAPQLNLADPQVRRLATRYVLGRFRDAQPPDMVSLEPSFGEGHDESSENRAMGSVSDRVAGLANDVAKQLSRDRPTGLIGIRAEGSHTNPPREKLERNVYVEIAVGQPDGDYYFDELLKQWSEKASRIGYRVTLSDFNTDRDMTPASPWGDVRFMQSQFQLYRKHQGQAVLIHTSGGWGPLGRSYYVASRLMWNPDADVEAILADFYEKAFGPAAEPMERFYDRLDPRSYPLPGDDLFARALRDLQEAMVLAEDRPDVHARLTHLQFYLRYVQLRWMIDRAQETANAKEHTLAAITHAFRTRYSYMNDWAAILNVWTNEAAQNYREPSWNARLRNITAPWAVGREYEPGDIESFFNDGLAYFVPESPRTTEFSNDLAPVREWRRGISATELGPLRGESTFGMFSINGEPLTFTLTAGMMELRRNRPAAKWRVVDAEGQPVPNAAGRVLLDGQPHDIAVEVPSPGYYSVEFNDAGSRSRLTANEGRPVAQLLRRDQPPQYDATSPRLYFYVPRGVRELHYYWQGPPHTVRDPRGNAFKDVSTTGQLVTIPIRSGNDGAIWSLTRVALGRLHFYNAPNVVATSAGSLLLPRELIAKDRMTVYEEEPDK